MLPGAVAITVDCVSMAKFAPEQDCSAFGAWCLAARALVATLRNGVLAVVVPSTSPVAAVIADEDIARMIESHTRGHVAMPDLAKLSFDKLITSIVKSVAMRLEHALVSAFDKPGLSEQLSGINEMKSTDDLLDLVSGDAVGTCAELGQVKSVLISRKGSALAQTL